MNRRAQPMASISSALVSARLLFSVGATSVPRPNSPPDGGSCTACGEKAGALAQQRSGQAQPARTSNGSVGRVRLATEARGSGRSYLVLVLIERLVLRVKLGQLLSLSIGFTPLHKLACAFFIVLYFIVDRVQRFLNGVEHYLLPSTRTRNCTFGKKWRFGPERASSRSTGRRCARVVRLAQKPSGRGQWGVPPAPFRLGLAQRQAVSAYGSLLERLRDRTPVMVIASIRLL